MYISLVLFPMQGFTVCWNTSMIWCVCSKKRVSKNLCFTRLCRWPRHSTESGLGYVEQVEAKFAEIGLGKIATVTGRFWAMDRDQRWNRVEKAYNVITGKSAEATAPSATAAIKNYYDNPAEGLIGDEFVPATQIVDAEGNALASVKDGDAVIFYNYRGDRPREITQAFITDGFEGFDRGEKLDIFFATMTEYQQGLCPNVLFPKPPKMDSILGGYVSAKGIPQFRCAEKEKYPHVTFFFNDFREEPFEGEDRTIVPSPKDCNTYDEKPEMSAAGVCAATEEAILSGKYGLVVVNFANPDMVGHTGNVEAAKMSCEVVDECIGTLLTALEKVGGNAVITYADHGNCDQMFDPAIEGAHTSHTLNPVEVVILGDAAKGRETRETGVLGDLAPTVLELMGLEKPEAMTGTSLLK